MSRLNDMVFSALVLCCVGGCFRIMWLFYFWYPVLSCNSHFLAKWCPKKETFDYGCVLLKWASLCTNLMVIMYVISKLSLPHVSILLLALDSDKWWRYLAVLHSSVASVDSFTTLNCQLLTWLDTLNTINVSNMFVVNVIHFNSVYCCTNIQLMALLEPPSL